MRSTTRFAGDLAFLNDFTPTAVNPYRHSRFLESDFEAPVWRLRIGKTPMDPINFAVILEDGSYLTDAKHRTLLEVFKSWICVHDHPSASGGRLASGAGARHKVQRTLHLIDHLLLNPGQFNLSEHGLMAMSSNDMRGVLIELGSGPRVAETLYGWSRRLSYLLREKGSQLAPEFVSEILSQVSELSARPNEDEVLGLSPDELIRARVWLWTHGYYRRRSTENSYGWHVDTARLCNDLYSNTLYGGQPKPFVPELFLPDSTMYLRERQRIPVNSLDEEDLPTQRHISAYIEVIRPLELLALAKLQVPLSILHALEEPIAGILFSVKAPGRFRTLPQEVVLSSLRKSVEFLLAHGDTIVEGYRQVLLHWKRSGLSFMQFTRDDSFSGALPESLRGLGVMQWSIRPLPEGRKSVKIVSPANYFGQLRANVGLYELLQVLYGASFFVVGVLSARRSGELDELPQECLDTTSTRLIFFNRKSAEGDMREREARPIPQLAVHVIDLLRRVAAAAREIGSSQRMPLLFSAPSRTRGLPSATSESVDSDKLLDVFCDYVQTPVDEEGRRHYIRQHQLRRFFVILFFWGGAMGGLDTLRWFLGHTDVEHLWHYISESVPGAVLRNVKAQFAVGQVLKDAPDAANLSDVLEAYYCTRDFSVLDAEELNQYVEELLLDGAVSVEPEFINLPTGKSFRILILTKQTPLGARPNE